MTTASGYYALTSTPDGAGRNASYRDFEDFLAALSHDKRKKIRQERRRVAEAGVGFRLVTGRDAVEHFPAEAREEYSEIIKDIDDGLKRVRNIARSLDVSSPDLGGELVEPAEVALAAEVNRLEPVIAAAVAAGASWQLFYGGRRRTSMAFLDELARYGERVSILPQDETGLLDLDAILGAPEDDTLARVVEPVVRSWTKTPAS